MGEPVPALAQAVMEKEQKPIVKAQKPPVVDWADKFDAYDAVGESGPNNVQVEESQDIVKPAQSDEERPIILYENVQS